MNDQGIDRLDDELAALLLAEREAHPSREALDKVWARLAVSLPNGGGPSGGGASGLGAKGFTTLLGVSLGGAAIVAAVFVAARPQPKKDIVHVERPAAPTSSTPAPVMTTSDIASTMPVVDSPPLPTARARMPTKPAQAQLDRERAVLDEARAALRNGDGPAALSAIDRHTRGFARPELAEEREALAVQALVLSARYDEARERAARFRASSPSSLFMPSVEASLASIP
ncbi:MAG TPA: hypothetical protein VLM85_10820 [Polyangiaceae bacterium]|nr:hypothetical protein [Polyangiaceae bacterium]